MMKVSRTGSGKSHVLSAVRKMKDYEFFCQGWIPKFELKNPSPNLLMREITLKKILMVIMKETKEDEVEDDTPKTLFFDEDKLNGSLDHWMHYLMHQPCITRFTNTFEEECESFTKSYCMKKLCGFQPPNPERQNLLNDMFENLCPNFKKHLFLFNVGWQARQNSKSSKNQSKARDHNSFTSLSVTARDKIDQLTFLYLAQVTKYHMHKCFVSFSRSFLTLFENGVSYKLLVVLEFNALEKAL